MGNETKTFQKHVSEGPLDFYSKRDIIIIIMATTVVD